MRHSGLGALRPEDRARYYSWWKKYVLLRRATGIAFVLFVASQLLRLADKPLAAFAPLALAPCLVVVVISGIWWAVLECPRCGERFRAWYGGEADYFGDECQSCGLTGAQLSSIAEPRG